jgi:DNA-binding Lrp family transcriptional regulator
MKSEFVQFPTYFKGITETGKQLDPTNIKILTAMQKFGPRNLLEVSRKTGLPFTSVYHRVAKLEEKTGRVSYVIPETAKLGLVRVVVLVTAKAGVEDLVSQALMMPNLWRMVNPCEGRYTHLSAHAVPPKLMKDFEQYLQRLTEMGLITQLQVIPTGDPVPYLPNFRYYDPASKRWSFQWTDWVAAIKKLTPDKEINDPSSYQMLFDKKDLLVIKELERNARRSLADMAPLLEMSLPAVKYRFDKRLRQSGVIQHVGFDVKAFPVEISAFHEVMLEFPTREDMNRFYSYLNELFFVDGVVKVLHRNALLVRTYIPETQLMNMFTFFSELANEGIITSYSPIRLSIGGRKTQTISYEIYEDEYGWMVDLKQCATELSKLVQKRMLLTEDASSIISP